MISEGLSSFFSRSTGYILTLWKAELLPLKCSRELLNISHLDSDSCFKQTEDSFICLSVWTSVSCLMNSDASSLYNIEPLFLSSKFSLRLRSKDSSLSRRLLIGLFSENCILLISNNFSLLSSCFELSKLDGSLSPSLSPDFDLSDILMETSLTSYPDLFQLVEVLLGVAADLRARSCADERFELLPVAIVLLHAFEEAIVLFIRPPAFCFPLLSCF
mmetsp:Transcript_37972/g.43604  ORF Transcript_37972/g.43604 Transcript_37972/m.43604 type:complete len:217 (+) Transcript_37972:68-718(+)